MQGSLGELNRVLAERIAKGELDLQTPGLSEHLWQTTMDKLAVDQPNYASYQAGAGASGEVTSVIRDARLPGATSKDRHIRARRPFRVAMLRIAPGMTTRHFPTHFGGRFSENAFGPST